MSIYNLPTNKIPLHLKKVIQAIQEILGEKAYDFMLIGATARDLILDGQYNLGIGRATLDIDFAIYVPERYSLLKNIYRGLVVKNMISDLAEPPMFTE
jgi:predicted nucleotidyltransferase